MSQNYRIKFYLIEYWINYCMLLEEKCFTDFFQISPQDLKNRISFFAVNYSITRNTATHNFYLNLWATEDFVY